MVANHLSALLEKVYILGLSTIPPLFSYVIRLLFIHHYFTDTIKEQVYRLPSSIDAAAEARPFFIQS